MPGSGSRSKPSFLCWTRALWFHQTSSPPVHSFLRCSANGQTNSNDWNINKVDFNSQTLHNFITRTHYKQQPGVISYTQWMNDSDRQGSVMRHIKHTYRYRSDAYVVEPVISSGVTWRDYSKKRNNAFTWAKQSNLRVKDLSHRAHPHLTKPFTRHRQDHLWLETLQLKIPQQRFAFKRIGISVTQENN